MTNVELFVPLLSLISVMLVINRLYHEIRQSDDRLVASFISLLIPAILLMNSSIVPANITYGVMLIIVALFVLIIDLSVNKKTSTNVTGRGRSAILLISIIPLWMWFVNILQNPELPYLLLLGRLLPGIFLLVFTNLVINTRLSWRLPALSFVVGSLFVNITALFAASAWRPCDQFKCGPFGALYIGGYNTENSLAMFSGAAFICSLAALSGYRRFLICLTFLLCLFATESRTSQLATLFGTAAFVMSTLIINKTGWRRKNVWAICFALFSTLSLSLVGLFLIMTSEPTSLSNRGNTWIAGIRALGDAWPVGLGIDRWVFYQSIGIVPPLFPHSEYLILIFGGGIFALALFAFILFKTILAGNIGLLGNALIIGFVIYSLVAGLTEVIWNPLALDGGLVFPAMFLLFLASGPGGATLSKRRERRHAEFSPVTK
ncbi:O-antigen ligase family protein [Arthrobacter psychrochitiniphilus]|uniref:O-antigen ligase family protein n=1 Tax=Arthrobacter psychrochitiniphilus TaxID=291045 RepID=UPI0011B66AEF|nr:O-antigen ligase family protein [Arthrobacter psychrochitiniphilus]NYG16585.1 hypothetical protein [Arthrobacter psychrochitiniphilus]